MIQLATVLKKIRQVFPGKDEKAILASLDEYGTESYEKEKHRVFLAILKLCDEENLNEPSRYIKVAKQDYRDVLSWAEYPNQIKFGPTKDSEKSSELIKKDKQHYQAWLNKL